MAVIHLKDRHTRDALKFERNLESVNSYVLVNDNADVDAFEISLSVGETYTDSFPAREEIFAPVPEDGVLLRPNSAMLFATLEVLSLPNNVYGVIFPKGSLFIRYALMVPTTKIDPGFHDNLYIFVQNMGSKPYRLKRGDNIAAVSFFSTDSTPSGIRKSQKPSHKGRMPRMRDTLIARFKQVGDKFWELTIAFISGGFLLALMQYFWSKQ